MCAPLRLDRLLADHRRGEIQSALHVLGVPPAARVRARVSAYQEGRGKHAPPGSGMAIAGIPATDAAAAGLAAPDFTVSLERDGEPEFHVWWLQVYFDGLDAYIDARWDPVARAMRTAIVGCETLATSADVDRVTLGLKRFQNRYGGPGRLPLDRDPFSKSREDVVAKGMALKARYPSLSWDNIARRVGVPPSTHKKWRLHYQGQQPN